MEFSYLGYQNFIRQVQLNTNLKFDAALEFESINIEMVTVKGEPTNVEKTQTSVIDIPIAQIQSMPALLGEVDVLKSIQLLARCNLLTFIVLVRSSRPSGTTM